MAAKEKGGNATSRIIPPLKWHIDGGKHYLAKQIVALMPPRCQKPNAPAPDDPGWLHYVEPYFGGGAVLLANDPEGISETVNDLHRGLTNFWRTLQDEALFGRFQRLIQVMPFSEEEYRKAAAICGMAAFMPSNEQGQVHLAADFFIRCRQSLSGRMDSFAPLSKKRTRQGMNEQAAAWLSAVEGLPAVHARLKRVTVLGPRPALEVIRQQDGPRTLFYLDPPYLSETRAAPDVYAHEMDRHAHVELLTALRDEVKGRFLLSGYHSPLYDAVAGKASWKCHEFDISNHASGGDTKRRMVECVWTNF